MARTCLLIVIVLLMLTVGCTRSQNPADSSVRQDGVSFPSPPFSTKEPDRYQATRTITANETDANGNVNKTRTSSVLIARDGLQRREEYEAGTLGTIVYLETDAGRFVLLPRAKIYANESERRTEAGSGQPAVEPEVLSPDYLLNESRISVQYERLGAEPIAGRTATKYRITTDSNSEMFIWVDESLGMPIASQSISIEGDVSKRVSMELRDIRTAVEPNLFALPDGYQQVDASQVRKMIRAAMAETGSKPPRN